MKQHRYELHVKWTGNNGTGTSGYGAYSRNHTIMAPDKPEIQASSDPAFRGDVTRYNPEEMLVASLSACHMLWYLHLCADAGIIVVDYTDTPTGLMTETANGGGQFSEVTLNPLVTVAEAHMADKANALHKKANEMCFIARSVNFPVHHAPQTRS